MTENQLEHLITPLSFSRFVLEIVDRIAKRLGVEPKVHQCVTTGLTEKCNEIVVAAFLRRYMRGGKINEKKSNQPVKIRAPL